VLKGFGVGIVDYCLDNLLLLGVENLGEVLVEMRLFLLES
jgi:hypothetical protein